MMHLSGFFMVKTNKKQGKSEQKRMIIRSFLAILNKFSLVKNLIGLRQPTKRHTPNPTYSSIFFSSS